MIVVLKSDWLSHLKKINLLFFIIWKLNLNKRVVQISDLNYSKCLTSELVWISYSCLVSKIFSFQTHFGQKMSEIWALLFEFQIPYVSENQTQKFRLHTSLDFRYYFRYSGWLKFKRPKSGKCRKPNKIFGHFWGFLTPKSNQKVRSFWAFGDIKLF